MFRNWWTGKYQTLTRSQRSSLDWYSLRRHKVGALLYSQIMGSLTLLYLCRHRCRWWVARAKLSSSSLTTLIRLGTDTTIERESIIRVNSSNNRTQYWLLPLLHSLLSIQQFRIQQRLLSIDTVGLSTDITKWLPELLGVGVLIRYCLFGILPTRGRPNVSGEEFCSLTLHKTQDAVASDDPEMDLKKVYSVMWEICQLKRESIPVAPLSSILNLRLTLRCANIYYRSPRYKIWHCSQRCCYQSETVRERVEEGRFSIGSLDWFPFSNLVWLLGCKVE